MNLPITSISLRCPSTRSLRTLYYRKNYIGCKNQDVILFFSVIKIQAISTCTLWPNIDEIKLLCSKIALTTWFLMRINLNTWPPIFFKGLYSKNIRSGRNFKVCGWFLELTTDILNALSSPVTKEDINAALFDMKPRKVPGLDGLYVAFF